MSTETLCCDQPAGKSPSLSGFQQLLANLQKWSGWSRNQLLKSTNIHLARRYRASPVVQMVKNLLAIQETWVQSLGWEDPLEKEMATHFSILAWRIPQTVACQAPLSMEFSRKKYWSGLSFPSPGDLANPGIEPRSPVLQADSLLTEPLGSYKQGKKTTLRMGENSK